MATAGTWSNGICDCCSDCHTCCLTFWCPCVAFGRIAEIADKGQITCCVHGGLFALLSCFTYVVGFPHVASIYACAYRTKLRKQYGIEGTECGDCCVSWFCAPCSICQEYRELTARGFDLAAGWDGNVKMHSYGATEAPAVQGGMSR